MSLSNEKKGLRSVAIHEASHAVMAILVGVKVERIKVWVAKDCYKGFCYMEIPKCPILDSYITLAGSVGQWLFAGEDEMRKEHLVTTDDYKDLRKRKVSARGMTWLFFHTKKILRTKRIEILKLASLLCEKRKIGSREIGRVVGIKKEEG